MLNITKKAKGFTLLEILIALFIFSGVLVLTTGIVGQSSGYQSKIGAIRAANQELQKVADMITNDIRLANTEGKIGSTTYTSGIAMFYCGSTNCTTSYLGTGFALDPAQSGAKKANTLVVFNKKEDAIKATVYQAKDNKVYYENNISTLDASYLRDFLSKNPVKIAGAETSSNIDTENDVTLNFAGIAPTTAQTQQAYVSFWINAKTRGHDTLPPNSRTNQTIRSLVAARNFK
ncbi:MAG TPA: type II secretion system protein [bacterium]|nr:type II secretion system protein [bacterium]